MGTTNVGSAQPCADGKPRQRLHGARRVVVSYRDRPEYAAGRERWQQYQTQVLLAHLEREQDPWVRRALARAVWVLAQPEHAAEARGLGRVEGDALCAAWLKEAGRGGAGTRTFAASGAEILRVQIRPVDPVPEGLVVEVRSAEGRVLRVTTFPDGLLVLPDLAAGVADVEVIPSAPTDAEGD